MHRRAALRRDQREAGLAGTVDDATSSSAQPTHAAVALLLLVPIPSLGAAVLLHLLPGAEGKVLYAISKAWILLLPVVWLLAVERGRLSLSPPRRGGLGVGLLSGLGIAAAILAAYAAVGRSWIDLEPFRAALGKAGFAHKGFYLASAIYVIFINAALEEYVWRWFVYRQCERLIAGSASVVASALLFAIHHVVAMSAYVGWDVTLLGCSGVFLGGVIWSALYRVYRSVWPGYLSHITADMAVYAIGWRLLF